MSRRLDIARGEGGFTLIELIVAMVLMVIVFGTIILLTSNLSLSARESQAGAGTNAQIRIASKLLSADLGRARAQLRAPQDAADLGASIADDLRVANPYSHDIIFASPTSIAFFGDVLKDQTAGAGTDAVGEPELVAYWIDGAGAGRPAGLPAGGTTCVTGPWRWCLIREVYFNPSWSTVRERDRGGAATWGGQIIEVLARGKSDYPRTTSCLTNGTGGETLGLEQRLLCYGEMVPAAGVRQCTTVWDTSNPANGTGALTWSDGWQPTDPRDNYKAGGGYGSYRLDRVTHIGFVPPGQANVADASKLGALSNGFVLRNRMTDEYLTAIGCGGA